MQTPDTFDQFARSYDATVQEAIGASGESLDFFNAQKARLARSVAPPDTNRVLDFGCGVGNITRALATEFPKAAIVGTDPSAESTAVARARSPSSVEFVDQSETRLPFDASGFDLAVAACVLHHIPVDERERWISELARVLRPGGRLIVFEHNPLNPLTQRVVRAVPFDADAVLLRRGQVIALLREAGLSVRQARYYNFFPRALASLRWVEPGLAWLPLGAQHLVVGER